ncbi:family 1 glycosylhydrolase [Pedobacter africanus]|uniref:dTDP-4-dehydrorhamnose reductase n=1 Tax=Pedobacter africanus TaxID=151894 RepID=A0A1W2CRA9_9SPHI|nr:family 1 glycosylhydrolase [Pedobacter africanus]SMC87741.1 dTDP-4-dehydrorhamnose reductase [Pedobacter africanus]
MEVWGGIECSINRIDKSYFDQLEYNDLYSRPEMLDEVIKLGIKTIRFPVLWEKNWPNPGEAPDWAVEKHLNLLKHRKINVIAGLVHHGSGPGNAGIHSDDFAEQLAIYAKMVAQKFPWINSYTPVNEPLTTARFCGLYGLWYPHQKNSKDFLNLLINQCKGTILAMRAIREVNPKAQLVFTEDLTKIHGTCELKHQITFENHRRWLSIDLLCGKVGHRHPLWKYIIEQGIQKDQLSFFIENPLPPDLLGFNYYVTSERYLDHKLEIHPPSSHGGNGRIAYADVEAVRHPEAKLEGIANLMKEAWQRYRLPMAITEAHLCCGREDQLRWLKSIWEDCAQLNAEGIQITAITFWALFGAYGWDKLLTEEKGNYESGVFDLSSGSPRPTAITKFITALARQKIYQSPLINSPGWWQNQEPPAQTSSPVLIIGGSGTLGTAFVKICSDRNIHFLAPKSNELNVALIEQIENFILLHKPWAIINAAGYVNVDIAEGNFEPCFLTNTLGPINLAKTCREHQILFLNFSSDLVFDGIRQAAYRENDPVSPLNNYGFSKAEAEKRVLSILPSSLIIRTSSFFGPWDGHNFVTAVLEKLKNGESLTAMDDVVITATYIPHLVHAALDLLIDHEQGIWHLTNNGSISWYELALAVAKRGGLDGSNIQPISQYKLNLPALRPANSALETSRGKPLPSLEKGLDEYFHQRL